MTDAMAHRGPDDAGVEIVANGQLGLGHRRLSILDLSRLGHQPMAHSNGKVWIVFNGEIYNFREIRADLLALGETFDSESDTEVVLAAYVRWGLACFERFRGMFAFALWDDDIEELLLARDRFGVKPLYYALDRQQLSFASEIRGLLTSPLLGRTVSATATAEFLRYGYVSAPRSLLQSVTAVPPGSIVRLNRTLRPAVTAYWSAQSLFDSAESAALRSELAILDDDALLDRVESSLTEAFALRMVSDVPVGLFLSGGIDSTLVATLLTRRCGMRLRTYTIGYADRAFNEIPYARAIARELNSDHTELEVSEATALRVTEQLPEITSEPIGDSSAIPTFLVCKLARESVKVALSADGADELFGGYPRYNMCGRFAQAGRWQRLAYYASAELLDALPPALVRGLYHLTRRGGPGYASISDKVRKFVRMARSNSIDTAYDAIVSECSDADARALLAQADGSCNATPLGMEPSSGTEPRDQFMLTDLRRYLVGDLLTKLDRMSMAVSLEAREPFLDHNAAAIAAALPMDWKIRSGRGKYILRRLLARHLSSEFFNRPKQGFSAPVGAWMRGALRPTVEHMLSAESVRKAGLLDVRATERTVCRFMSERGAVSAAGLWHILQLQMWAVHRAIAGPVSVEP